MTRASPFPTRSFHSHPPRCCPASPPYLCQARARRHPECAGRVCLGWFSLPRYDARITQRPPHYRVVPFHS
ncbi:hypothetical protein E2C01_081105 [Portunus trituberculatus]|uniref:Uncharacterized protein n=1 Tax=Portunus trituberculatus TaxID=210409 RepID=A0A5B7IR29_PORTR|nr:hypothetical protein [Portunus trituberculatus]